MYNENLDALFIMSSGGDKISYNFLFEAFLQTGKMIAASTIAAFNASKYISPIDLYDEICEIFLVVIKNFDPHSSDFETYSKFILNKRLIRAVSESVNPKFGMVISLDQVDKDNRPLIESIEDKSIVPITEQVSTSSFEEKLFSKNTRGNRKTATRNKIMRMLLNGYTKKEIAAKLGISIGKLRYILKTGEKEIDFEKIKMDLK